MTPGPIDGMGLKSVGVSPRCRACNSRPALRRADVGKLRRSSLEDETREIDLFNVTRELYQIWHRKATGTPVVDPCSVTMNGRVPHLRLPVFWRNSSYMSRPARSRCKLHAGTGALSCRKNILPTHRQGIVGWFNWLMAPLRRKRRQRSGNLQSRCFHPRPDRTARRIPHHHDPNRTLLQTPQSL